MSQVRILRTYADGSSLEVEVYADSSYPDALAEAKATAVACYLGLPDAEITDGSD